VDTFLAFAETEQSKIFPNEALGYWKVTVERPLRLRVDLTDMARAAFRAACAEADEEPLANLIDRLAAALGPGPHTDYNAFLEHAQADAERHNVKLTARRLKLLQSMLAQRDEAAAPVIKKLHKPGKAEVALLFGRYALTPGPVSDRPKGRGEIVEYEPDPDLRDTEQVPLLEDGGIEAFIKREVWPHVPDAWVDEGATKIGYEISFTRYFYKPQPLRALDEIRADILALEKETEGLLGQIVGEGEG
jgi:type I restriction enzyme M protein